MEVLGFGPFLTFPDLQRTGWFFSKSAKGLVTNYGEGGGATKREGGGASEVLPLHKEGVEIFWR